MFSILINKNSKSKRKYLIMTENLTPLCHSNDRPIRFKNALACVRYLDQQNMLVMDDLTTIKKQYPGIAKLAKIDSNLIHPRTNKEAGVVVSKMTRSEMIDALYL
jgi:hypothetical protein